MAPIFQQLRYSMDPDKLENGLSSAWKSTFVDTVGQNGFRVQDLLSLPDPTASELSQYIVYIDLQTDETEKVRGHYIGSSCPEVGGKRRIGEHINSLETQLYDGAGKDSAKYAPPHYAFAREHNLSPNFKILATLPTRTKVHQLEALLLEYTRIILLRGIPLTLTDSHHRRFSEVGQAVAHPASRDVSRASQSLNVTLPINGFEGWPLETYTGSCDDCGKCQQDFNTLTNPIRFHRYPVGFEKPAWKGTGEPTGDCGTCYPVYFFVLLANPQ